MCDKDARSFFQSKINKDIEDSVGGLNKAAKLLADAGWKGLFLYLIVLGEEAELGTSHEHPTILVTPRHYNEFFSPTFSYFGASAEITFICVTSFNSQIINRIQYLISPLTC